MFKKIVIASLVAVLLVLPAAGLVSAEGEGPSGERGRACHAGGPGQDGESQPDGEGRRGGGFESDISQEERPAPPEDGGQRGRRCRPARVGGLVTSVDVAGSTFTIQTRNDKSVALIVTEETRFASRLSELNGLEDLAVDMAVMVGVKKQEDGSLLALGVLEIDPELLNSERAFGVLVSVDGNSFTVQTRGEDRLTFEVDGDTLFVDRSGDVQGL
ncbi:MAG: DUF5666 domain-containing protein, partial [Anaerolineae bacterium]|nr:DUF5666 domain-containing protein [Anaerolineae bacterium]